MESTILIKNDVFSFEAKINQAIAHTVIGHIIDHKAVIKQTKIYQVTQTKQKDPAPKSDHSRSLRIQKWEKVAELIKEGSRVQDATRKVFGYPVKIQYAISLLKKHQLIEESIISVNESNGKFKQQYSNGQPVEYGTVIPKGEA